MKLAGQAALRFFARPDPGATGLLIYGADPMRVAHRRQEVIAALIGPEGESEMRLIRMPASDLRKDGAALSDAMRARGFFPGPRAVLVEDATDALAEPIIAALKEWRAGDATVIVTAGALAAKSALRKGFEAHPAAFAAGIYDDPPSREEIEATLTKAGLAPPDRAAMADLMALARALDPGDFRQTVEKIALYKWGDTTPLTPAEVAASAPAMMETEIDDVLNLVAERQPEKLGAMLRRMEGQGILPVTLCIGALRHFRALHVAASDPGGPAEGLARMRPPVFGPRRDRMLGQAERWGRDRLEQALALLIETDLSLRSSTRAPGMAVMERALIRLAMAKG